MRIEIHKLGPHQTRAFVELLDVFEEVFEMKHFKSPGNEHLEGLLQQDDFFCFCSPVRR